MSQKTVQFWNGCHLGQEANSNLIFLLDLDKWLNDLQKFELSSILGRWFCWHIFGKIMFFGEQIENFDPEINHYLYYFVLKKAIHDPSAKNVKKLCFSSEAQRVRSSGNYWHVFVSISDNFSHPQVITRKPIIFLIFDTGNRNFSTK